MDDGGTERSRGRNGQPIPRVTDRRRQRRRTADRLGNLAVRGLLHDLGHEITTLSYLVEAVRGDLIRSADPGARMELVSAQLARLLDIITHALAGDTGDAAESAEVRGLASQIAQLASAAYGTSVRVVPGPAVTVPVSPTLLWRVLSNLVDNAARAAGPMGHVEVAMRQTSQTVIDVIDDGPGFGDGPPGLGLRVTASLLESSGGRLEVQAPRPRRGGAMVRVVLPSQGSQRPPTAVASGRGDDRGQPGTRR
jgi:signal transduction histidine kinase